MILQAARLAVRCFWILGQMFLFTEAASFHAWSARAALKKTCRLTQ
jgi:hypothetical protein